MKIPYFDKFQCIAGQCPVTCCEGWDIALDSEACWRRAKEGIHYEKEEKKCPFLQEDKLCHIVSCDGEMALPDTCQKFPRLIHEYEEETESLLSFACPAVVDIVREYPELAEQSIVPENQELTVDSYIRFAMLQIMESEDYELSLKLILVYQYLMMASECEEDDLEWDTEDFISDEGLAEAAASWEYTDIQKEDTVGEGVELLFDILEDYKEVTLYQHIFQDILEYAQNYTEEQLAEGFELFHGIFAEYETLLQNVYRDKIYEACRNEDIEDTIVNYEFVAIEYAMVRMAAFLKWKQSGEQKVNYEQLRNYIVAFSRIIGHNSETFLEFIEESFGDTIIELGYIGLLLL